MDLRGKPYLQVPYRVLWFREMHPNWSIETEVVYRDEKYALLKATIRDEGGRIMAQAHKDGRATDFKEFVGKAETGAIGRALGLVGCGTQFCTQDLDEEPEEGDPAKNNPSHYVGVDSGIDRPKAKIDTTKVDRMYLMVELKGLVEKKQIKNEIMTAFVAEHFEGRKTVELTNPELIELIEEVKKL